MKIIRHPNLPALIIVILLGLIPWTLLFHGLPDWLPWVICAGCSALALISYVLIVLRNRKREKNLQAQIQLYMAALGRTDEADSSSVEEQLHQLGEAVSEHMAAQDQNEKVTVRFLSDWSKKTAEIISELNASAKRVGEVLPDEERRMTHAENTLRCRTEQLMRYFDCDESDTLRRTQTVDLIRILSDAIIRRSEDLRARKIGLRRNVVRLRVVSDPVLLATVLDELLDNAIRHTPDSGTIGMICREADGKAEIVIEDAGCGIPADELPCIFDRGYVGRGEDCGRAGLGLFTARSYCELMGHRISIRSVQGKGTQAILQLNLAPAEKAE